MINKIIVILAVFSLFLVTFPSPHMTHPEQVSVPDLIKVQSLPFDKNGTVIYNGKVTLSILLNDTAQLPEFLSYLNSYNLNYEVSKNSMFVFVNGYSTNIEKAFHNKAYVAENNAYYYFTDSYLPEIFKGLISSITGFDNLTRASNFLTYNPSITSGPYSPQDLWAAYQISPLITLGDQGYGNTIAIIDAYGDPSIATDLQTFSQYFNLAAPDYTIIYPLGQPTKTSKSWALETALDMEVAHSIAPQAKLLLVITPDDSSSLESAVSYVISNKLADVISLSWGAPEQSYYSKSLDSSLQWASNNNITVIASSGDNGSYPGGSSTPAVEYPASDPYVTSVGGTALYMTSNGYGYETAWNKSGGGYSKLFSAPSWQKGVGFDSTQRGIPDIALVADPNTGVRGYFNGLWYTFGGTSVGAPLFAGMVADLNQYFLMHLGFLNPYLYGLFDSKNYNIFFNDITQGSNGAYTATIGWDPVTGIGSPNLYNIATSSLILDFKVGAVSGPETLHNFGISAEIRTNIVYPVGSATNYFWIGENVTGLGFVETGYFVEKFKAQYFIRVLDQNGNVSYFYPDQSIVLQNNNLNTYSFTFNSNQITFYFNNKFVKSLSIGTNFTGDTMMYAIAESNNSRMVNNPLGPVEFKNLKYLKNGVWHSVLSATMVKKSNSDVLNMYSVNEVPYYTNDFIAGLYKLNLTQGSVLWPSNNDQFFIMPPIIIAGSDGLSVDNGVFPGNGTVQDPYRITGWQFDTLRTAIILENLNVTVVVENNYFNGSMIGLELRGSKAIIIRNNIFENNYIAIFSMSSNILNITNNTFKTNGMILFSISSQSNFYHNQLSDNLINYLFFFSNFAGLSFADLFSVISLIFIIIMLVAAIAAFVIESRKKQHRNV